MASEVHGEVVPVGDEGPPKKIRRTKTGCQTCRNRRKKCDENRPNCKNCTKIGAECPGYLKPRKWETTPVGRRALASKRASSDRELPFVQPNFQQPFPASSFDFNEPLGEWDMFAYAPASSMAVLEVCAPQYTESYNYQICIPYQLSCLIAGIETNLHRELFQHFTEVTSRILLSTNNEANPLRETLISLALSDTKVIATLLSLAGSHLLRVIPPGVREDVALETRRLHKEVVQTQSKSLAMLKNMHQNSDARLFQYRETIFTIYLLLCMYSNCQGSKDNSSFNYLSKAREVLILGSPLEMGQDDGRETIVTDINPYLLEFFLCHDSLATVTLPFHGASRTRIRGLTASQHGPFMIDLLDSFSDFTVGISALRTRSISSTENPIAAVSSIGLNIEQDLVNWRPEVPPESSRMAVLYCGALFLWLKSIVAPSQLQDPPIRDFVSQNILGISDITDNNKRVSSCLLFPLFVLGAICTSEPDRLNITTQFQKLRNWSNFGNIDDTEGLVRQMWQNHDRGLPRSWDWVAQLEIQNMSLLVS